MVPARPAPTKIVRCLTCDAGFRELSRGLAFRTGEPYWPKRRELEALHGHFFISDYPASLRIVWEVHCEHCHEAGETL